MREIHCGSPNRGNARQKIEIDTFCGAGNRAGKHRGTSPIKNRFRGRLGMVLGVIKKISKQVCSPWVRPKSGATNLQHKQNAEVDLW